MSISINKSFFIGKDLITSVDIDENQSGIKSRDIKLNVVPNPFNNFAIISFTLPEAENINITIFDVNGRKVKEIQNYPNPFNPVTTITVRISREKELSLIVYNILGERIKRLFDGNLAVGEHQILWDGRDDFGNQAVSGIYFYQLKSDTFIETKKMLLLR